MNKTLHTPQGDEVPKWLVELRKRAGLTQRELAKLAGALPSTIAKMELKEWRVDVVQFYLLCKAMKVDPAREAKRLFEAFDAARRKHGRP
ncbi:MAG: helix-turn-helix transcriptional regulator [Planctomycetota bacterium]